VFPPDPQLLSSLVDIPASPIMESLDEYLVQVASEVNVNSKTLQEIGLKNTEALVDKVRQKVQSMTIQDSGQFDKDRKPPF